MKRWILSIVISLIPIFCLVFYFYKVLQEAVCINSAGFWLGFYQGCDLEIGGGFYAINISPITAVLYTVAWLALIWIVNLVLKRFQVLNG